MKQIWLKDVQWVGPKRRDLGNREHFTRVLDISPHKNSSGARVDSPEAWVWLGTTDNWNDYGRGPMTKADAAAVLNAENGARLVESDVQPGREVFYQ